MSGGAWIDNLTPVVLKFSYNQKGAGSSKATKPLPPMDVLSEWFVSDNSMKPGTSVIACSSSFPQNTSIQLLKYDPTENNEQHVSSKKLPLSFGDSIYISAGPPNSPCLIASANASSWSIPDQKKTQWSDYRWVISTLDYSMTGIVPPGYNCILFNPNRNVYLHIQVVLNQVSGIPDWPIIYADPSKPSNGNTGNISFIPIADLWWKQSNSSPCVQRSPQEGFTQGANNVFCNLGLPGSSLLYSMCTTAVPTCTQNLLGPNVINALNYDIINYYNSNWRPFNYQSDCVNFNPHVPDHIPWTPVAPIVPNLVPPPKLYFTKQQLILLGILTLILIFIFWKLVKK